MSRWERAWYHPLNLWDWLQNEAERLRIVARWLPVIWHDADFDHSFLWHVMEHKFRRMARYAEVGGHCVSSARQARELRLAAALCHRLSEDDYIFVAGCPSWKVAHPFGKAANYTLDSLKFRHHQEQNDVDALTRLMRRKALCWWN